MLFTSSLRRRGGAQVLRSVNHFASVHHGGLTCPTHSRSFASSHQVTGYVLARAKVMHLAARSLLKYHQLLQLDSASSPVSRYFTRGATLRERVYMYLVCLVPPDQPIDLADFLAGAKQAANAVIHQIYVHEDGLASSEGEYPTLKDMASSDVIHKWTLKLEAQREALHLPQGTKFTLEKLEVHDAALAEVEYAYSEADDRQEAETRSKFQLNESLRMKVRFAVTEHLRTEGREGDHHPTHHTLKTTFDWSFYSNVSRAHLIDWFITDSTPFKLQLATDKHEVGMKVPAQL